jgi:hypothetical protein
MDGEVVSNILKDVWPLSSGSSSPRTVDYCPSKCQELLTQNIPRRLESSAILL